MKNEFLGEDRTDLQPVLERLEATKKVLALLLERIAFDMGRPFEARLHGRLYDAVSDCQGGIEDIEEALVESSNDNLVRAMNAVHNLRAVT